MSDGMDRATYIPAEQQRILDKGYHPTGAFAEFRKEEIEQSVPERFEQIVRMYPDRLAFKGGNEALTYAELDRVANCIAQAILDRRGERIEPVTLLFERGAQAIAAMLAVLKAGKFYVPLDAAYPRARLDLLLSDSQAELTLTNSDNLAVARELVQDEAQLLNVDALESAASCDSPHLSIRPDDPAYILYTSGSTGEPKGVFDNHRNLLHHIMTVTNEFHFCPDDRQTLLRSHSFNGALRDIFSSLLNGLSIHSFVIEKEGLHNLADFLIRERITIYRTVVSVFRQFAGTLSAANMFPELRLIHVGGETVYKSDVDLFKAHFSPNAIMLNGLGITEAATVSHFYIDHQTQIADSVVPIGYPVEDKQVLLLEEDRTEVADGETGEIAIKSRYLSTGYWNRPDLTREKYLTVPGSEDERIYLTGDIGRKSPDGSFVHMGRKDFQVKTRGHRIELREIELALLGSKDIKEAVVITQDDGAGDNRLVAYVAPDGKTAPGVSTIRRRLADMLPDYMMPSSIVILDALPLTRNGKVDRSALPSPGTARPDLDTRYVAPRTPVEEKLADMWKDLLEVDQVGIHDSFFELGGHSLLASQIVSRVITTFHVDLPVKALFDSPTVAEMAPIITGTQAKVADPHEIGRMLAELETLSNEQATQLLIDPKP